MDAHTRQVRDTWANIPTEILRSELQRRAEEHADGAEEDRPVCGSGQQGAYDTPMHVVALAIILLISTLACGFPLIKRRLSKNTGSSKIIFYCQHFGTGVLIATAFVHLLPTAFLSLTDPCLPKFFTETYNPLAGLISMIFAIFVVLIESYLTTRGAGHSHSHSMWDDDEEDHHNHNHKASSNGGTLQSPNGLSTHRAGAFRPQNLSLRETNDTQGLMENTSPTSSGPSTPTKARLGNGNGTGANKAAGNEGYDDEDTSSTAGLNVQLDEFDPQGASASALPTHRRYDERREPGEPAGPASLPSEEEQKRMMLQCLLLEAGILFHSVFIGMAISVATGTPFIVFLIAISFHQCFEGLALGSRIAAIHFPRSSIKPWLMVLAYGLTTPIGQAIGLIVHNLYDPLSQTGLLMVGIMNAISSGLLIFAGLVQLLAEDFLTEKSYKTLYGKRRTQAFICVIGGATLMSVVGAFA